MNNQERYSIQILLAKHPALNNIARVAGAATWIFRDLTAVSDIFSLSQIAITGNARQLREASGKGDPAKAERHRHH